MSICQRYKNGSRISPAEITAANDDELLELKLLVDTNTDRIGHELDLAKAEANAGGEFADPLWFAKTKGAKRVMGRISQAIQIELGKRRKEKIRLANEDPDRIWMRCLGRAMEEVLSTDQRAKVLARAQEIRDQKS